MKKKKDVLLQQIAENNRKSTVFFLTGYAVEQPIGLKSKDTAGAAAEAFTGTCPHFGSTSRRKG